MFLTCTNVYFPVYVTGGYGVTTEQNNKLDAFNPEIWANESLAILIENMVMGNLVHTDFKDEVARFGDVVNTRKPGTFVSKRKTDEYSVTTQNATATNVPVHLDQHHHVSFIIYDGEDSMSFKDLVAEYLSPAIIAIASEIDRILLGQTVQFIGNCAGYLTMLSSTTAKEYILETRKVMNDNKVPNAERNLILGSGAEMEVLKDDSFTSAEKVGDDGTALREASIGRKLGFNIFMDQNASDFTFLDYNTATDINNGNLTPGSTALTLTSVANVAVGDMITVSIKSGGTLCDEVPQRVTAVNGTTAVVTVHPGLKRTIEDACVVNIYDGCLIKQATKTRAAGAADTSSDGYRQGWHGGVIVDGFTANKPPVVGQPIQIGTATVCASTDAMYTITQITYTAGATEATLVLDRPLDAAIVDNAIVSLYPTGSYSFAFHRNALALVTRPLSLPREGTGALSAIASYNGLGIRVVITYDGSAQGHRVTVDLLCGVKVLDTDLGAVMLG